MAKISCSFVAFNQPVFSKGKNFGDKVHANNQTGVKLTYDTDIEMMVMEYKGNVTVFQSFHSADVHSPATIGYAPEPIAPSPQVSIPQANIKGKSKFIKPEYTENQGE